MNLKYTLNFYIRQNQNDEPSKIRALVSYNGYRPEIYTNTDVKPSEWDKTIQRIKNPKDPRNKDINKVEEIFENIFKEFDVIEKRFPTVDELKIKFAEKTGKGAKIKNIKALTFVECIDEYASEQGEKDSWTIANYNRFNKLKNHFSFFDSKLLIKNTTEKSLIALVKYFQTKPVIFKSGKPGEPHKNTTVSRTLKDVRTVLKWAKRKGFYEGDLHETFYPKFKGVNYDINYPIYLSWERLLQFYNHKFSKNQKHLETTRDIIAFCCFTSLRYSDVFNLKKHQLRKGFFYVTTIKTTDSLKIDINDYSREIIEKYKDLPGEKVLPVKSMKEANEQIKEIGRILEFDELVNYTYFIGEKRYDEVMPFCEIMTTHIGRKTFIVNSLYLGIPAEVIMKWTGHKDYQSMKPYIAIVDDLKKSEMSKFNKK